MLDSDVIIIITLFSCLLTVLDIILEIRNISLTDMTLHVYVFKGSCKDMASKDNTGLCKWDNKQITQQITNIYNIIHRR